MPIRECKRFSVSAWVGNSFPCVVDWRQQSRVLVALEPNRLSLESQGLPRPKLCCHRQDFAIGVNTMWNLWRQRKAETEDVKDDLLRSRERGSLAAIQNMDAIVALENAQSLRDQVAHVQASLRARQQPFRGHDLINVFVERFDERHFAQVARFKFLVMVGPSVQGKTSKGMSLYPDRTLKVSCGGCPEGVLPPLSSFDRALHAAILFDEVRPDQVLPHRELFQANQYWQTLGQSACNNYAYRLWVYGIALILCANSWDTSSDKISPADREWLEANSIVVRLPDGERWY